MFYADRVGLAKILRPDRRASIASSAQRWEPAPLLDRLAAAGATFRDFDRAQGVS